MWFNSPFCLNVGTNIGKMLLKCKNNFLKANMLSKVFNKNTIKISFSSSRNLKSIISSHNKQLLTPNIKQTECNCRVENCCLLGNKCILYIKLTSQITFMVSKLCYIGLLKAFFKGRSGNLSSSSFSYKNTKNSTDLLKYVWPLKGNCRIMPIKPKIVKKKSLQ